jgi:hypothetical protein
MDNHTETGFCRPGNPEIAQPISSLRARGEGYAEDLDRGYDRLATQVWPIVVVGHGVEDGAADGSDPGQWSQVDFKCIRAGSVRAGSRVPSGVPEWRSDAARLTGIFGKAGLALVLVFAVVLLIF